MSTPNITTPKEKYQHLKEMFLTEVFQQAVLCADSGKLKQHAENIYRPGK